MKDYSQIEHDLVKVLTDDVNLSLLADIKSLPENEADQRVSLVKPKLYVVYTGSDYGSPENNAVVIQEETMSFEIIIRSRNRRGNGGILDLLSQCGSLLQGKKMYIGCDPITLSKSGFIDGGPNDYNYVLALSIVTKSASIVSDDDNVSEGVYLLKCPEFKRKE